MRRTTCTLPSHSYSGNQQEGNSFPQTPTSPQSPYFSLFPWRQSSFMYLFPSPSLASFFFFFLPVSPSHYISPLWDTVHRFHTFSLFIRFFWRPLPILTQFVVQSSRSPTTGRAGSISRTKVFFLGPLFSFGTRILLVDILYYTYLDKFIAGECC